MPLTVSNTTGDGINTIYIQCSIELPDSGQTVNVTGMVQAPGQAAVPITGSPLTMPPAPGSGSTYWNIQVNTTSGVASVQQSSSSDPPALASNVVIFRQTLVPSSGDPALTPDSTPDDY